MDGRPGATPGEPGTRQWQDRLWTSLLNAKDKGRKQEESEDSWSKRNLFAIFVLIPLIIGLLSLSIWCMTYGVNLLDIVPRVSLKVFSNVFLFSRNISATIIVFLKLKMCQELVSFFLS